MRILITGGHGQLGRALQQALAGHQLDAPGRAQLDVTDPGTVGQAVDRGRPDLVIHAAAWTDTAGCEADPDRAQRVNAGGTRHVAQACAGMGIPLLYISTNEVFGGRKTTPYGEEDDAGPLNAYARSKWEGERHVRALCDRHYIVRTSWLYGAGRASFPEKIIQAARAQGSLKVVTDETASPTWTADLAHAIARLATHPAWGTYHLTNSGPCSRLEWARAILDLAGLSRVEVEPTTQAEFGAPFRKPAFSALANRNAARLGITLRPWQEALSDYFVQEYAPGTAARRPAS